MTRMMLGSVIARQDIASSLGPFKIFPRYKIAYPAVVVWALIDLYMEYNQAFTPLVAANREWEHDYQYCVHDAAPANWVVQIDMLGLDHAFLDAVKGMHVEQVRELLRHRIFEIENSIAMYSVLSSQFGRSEQTSVFSARFRDVLDALRQRFRRPIALLATTEEKYAAMRATEFGKNPGETLTDAEVRLHSGFDTFFGPEQFIEYLDLNGGAVHYLLYVRASDPPSKLKKPEIAVENPLLGNAVLRRLIKANAITLNLDAPDMPFCRRINDTKAYMAPMEMAFPITSDADLYTQDSADGELQYSPAFVEYLRSQGVATALIAERSVVLRCKPVKGAYGCYGHLRGGIQDRKFRNGLRRNMRLRGEYVVQVEMAVPSVTNTDDGATYAYIDRNFVGMVSGRPAFLSGVRTLMPIDSEEARHGRIHGNATTVFAEIVEER